MVLKSRAHTLSTYASRGLFGLRRSGSMTWSLITALGLLLCGHSARAEEPLTIGQALEEARAANVRLPVSRLDVAIAREAAAQSRARLGPWVGVLGQFRYMPPGLDYGPGASAGEQVLQLIGRQPLYAGGALRAQIDADREVVRSADARLRADERDVDLMVRSGFSEILELGAEIAARSDGIERLRNYLTFVQSREASGQGVEGDLLKTESRLANQEADLSATRARLIQAKLAFNDLVGRAPTAPLVLAPLPLPRPPGSAPSSGLGLPDIVAVAAQRWAAEAQIRVARGQFLPQLSLAFDTGFIDPGFGQYGQDAGLSGRLRNDFGLSIGIDLSWNIWSFDLYRAREREARRIAERAAQNVVVMKRAANLAHARAEADLDLGFQELCQRDTAVPLARDAFVEAESIYRGGDGTALEVLDAFTTFVDTQIAYAQALLGYRISEATLRRWSSP
jgi:outer membrane protein